MNVIAIDISKVNSYILPNIQKAEVTIQSSYSCSQGFKEYLPKTFSYKDLVNDMVNQIYSIQKEISNVGSMISKKNTKAKEIEKKRNNSISKIVSEVAKMGAAKTGAVSGALVGTFVGTATKSSTTTKTKTKTKEKKKNKTGAKIFKNVVSAVKKVIVGTYEKVTKTASKVANKVKAIWEKAAGKIEKVFNKAKDVAKTTFKKIKDTGAKVVKSTTSKLKKLGSKIKDGFKKIGSKIKSGAKTAAKWVKDTTKTATEWVKDKFNKVKDWTCNAVKDTGAWISKAAKATWSWIKGAASTVWTHMKKIGASVANAVISLIKGLVRLVESLADFVILLGSGVGTIGTALYDVGRGIVTGNWDMKATKGLWKGTKSIVAYDCTNKWLFDPLYKNTGFGRWLDDNAYGWFKSDGIGCQIAEGVGYIAGVVAITVVTFGVGGVAVGTASTVATGVTATTLAITATAAGIGKYTAEEWNDNCLAILYKGQEVGLTIDYEKYCEIEKLGDGQSTTITQQLTDENGNPCELKFTITKNGDTYSVKDDTGQDIGFNGVKESSTVKGLAVGITKGTWEGVQYYVGGKISGAQFTSVTSKMSSPIAKNLFRSGARVALDVGTGVAEVPFQSLVTMAADNKSWDESWEENGGWQAVGTQAAIAGITSSFGEAISFKGNLAIEKVNDAILSSDISTIENVIKNTKEKYVARALAEVSDEKLINLINTTDIDTSKIIINNLSGAKIKTLIKNVDSSELIVTLDNIFECYDVRNSIKLLRALSLEQVDNVLKNCDNFSDNVMSRFIKKTAKLYRDGIEVAMPNQKYNSFYCNFREHGIKHALAVAEYADKLGGSLDTINLEETLVAALSHDFGMRGGVIIFDKKMMGHIKKALSSTEGLTAVERSLFEGLNGKVMTLDDAHEILTKKLSNGKSLFSEKIFTMNFARSNHPLNSALDIIRYSESLPSGIDKEVVSLLAMTHSKSTSGISYFSSTKQWLDCVDKLKKAADFEGVEFDDKKLLHMIEKDPDTFARLQMEATIIRDADAMSPVVTKDGRTLMQEDSYTKVEILKRRDSYDDPTVMGENGEDIGRNIETENLSDVAYNSDGTTRTVTDPFSKRIHAGELNTEYDSTIHIDASGKKVYRASVKILDPTEIPYSTFGESIKERLGEIKTYTNFDERSFEIILPKEAKGTGLAAWYQARLDETIDGFEEDLTEDLSKGVIDEATEKLQREFFEKLRKSIVYR